MKHSIKDAVSRFGFHCTPFTREITVRDRFPLDEFDDAMNGLLEAIHRRMSCALIAPAGTGKTALLRALVASLPEARYRTHYVKVTGLSKRDMCREIAAALGLAVAGTFPSLVRKLQVHFSETVQSLSLRPVLILDEAHDLRPEVLAMLRILTNFDMDSRLVLSVVLAGQPRLRELLRREELDDMAKRLAHCATLRPLSRDETKSYIEHRCTIAGSVTVPFDDSATDAIYELGRGNLRATDQLARKGLDVAHKQDHDVVSAVDVAHGRKQLWP